MGESIASAEQHVANRLLEALNAGKRTLWLVSGGSCITSECRIATLLAEQDTDFELLTVLPIDERFGPSGHESSNIAALRVRGFEANGAKLTDVLSANGDFPSTLAEFDSLASEAFSSSEMVIACLGIGADGHTAGILPNSPAITDTVSLVVGYEWTDYTRLTLGIAALKRIDVAFVFAYGEAKRPALLRLQTNQETLSELPAKVLYEINDVVVFNDTLTNTEETA